MLLARPRPTAVCVRYYYDREAGVSPVASRRGQIELRKRVTGFVSGLAQRSD